MGPPPPPRPPSYVQLAPQVFPEVWIVHSGTFGSGSCLTAGTEHVGAKPPDSPLNFPSLSRLSLGGAAASSSGGGDAFPPGILQRASLLEQVVAHRGGWSSDNAAKITFGFLTDIVYSNSLCVSGWWDNTTRTSIALTRPKYWVEPDSPMVKSARSGGSSGSSASTSCDASSSSSSVAAASSVYEKIKSKVRSNDSSVGDAVTGEGGKAETHPQPPPPPSPPADGPPLGLQMTVHGPFGTPVLSGPHPSAPWHAPEIYYVRENGLRELVDLGNDQVFSALDTYSSVVVEFWSVNEVSHSGTVNCTMELQQMTFRASDGSLVPNETRVLHQFKTTCNVPPLGPPPVG